MYVSRGMCVGIIGQTQVSVCPSFSNLLEIGSLVCIVHQASWPMSFPFLHGNTGITDDMLLCPPLPGSCGVKLRSSNFTASIVLTELPSKNLGYFFNKSIWHIVILDTYARWNYVNWPAKPTFVIQITYWHSKGQNTFECKCYIRSFSDLQKLAQRIFLT